MFKAVLAEAMTLPDEDRRALIGWLHRSLKEEADAALAAEEMAEWDRRVARFNIPIPTDDQWAEIKLRLSPKTDA